VEVIYNGVDLDLFHPHVDGSSIRESLKVSRGVPLFGMVANFAGKKSHDIFFAAARVVLKDVPEATFLLVGAGDYTPYQNQLTAQGYGKNFIFTGFRNDIPQIIAALDFSVISSKKGEGLTGSIVEAMAMAKPVICTAVAGNPELIKDKETGLLVPPGSAEMLARAMLYVLRNRGEAEKMGGNAFGFVKDKVDNRKRSKHFEALYRSILRRKGVC
ncbi:MAG: glycosyltransferase family 4 protein, partial [Pseudomonadota bacterium]